MVAQRVENVEMKGGDESNRQAESFLENEERFKIIALPLHERAGKRD